MALKRPLLRLLDGLVYSVSELNGQPDEVYVGDSPVPGCGERLNQLAFDCRRFLTISKVILTYFAPEILNPVIGWARSASWSCSSTSSW